MISFKFRFNQQISFKIDLLRIQKVPNQLLYLQKATSFGIFFKQESYKDIWKFLSKS